MTEHKNERRYNDTIECSHCGKQWDIDDPEPPQCITWPEKLRQQLKESKDNENRKN